MLGSTQFWPHPSMADILVVSKLKKDYGCFTFVRSDGQPRQDRNPGYHVSQQSNHCTHIRQLCVVLVKMQKKLQKPIFLASFISCLSVTLSASSTRPQVEQVAVPRLLTGGVGYARIMIFLGWPPGHIGKTSKMLCSVLHQQKGMPYG